MFELDLPRQDTLLRMDGQTVVIASPGGVPAGDFAERFAAAGATVVLLAHAADERGAGAATPASARRCAVLPGDLTDPDFCQDAALEAAFLGRGWIDVLVILTEPLAVGGPFEDAPEAATDEALHRSVCCLWRVTRAALPHMPRDGRIIHVVPLPHAETGETGVAAHHALLGFGCGLLGTLEGARGLRVDTLSPRPADAVLATLRCAARAVQRAQLGWDGETAGSHQGSSDALQRQP